MSNYKIYYYFIMHFLNELLCINQVRLVLCHYPSSTSGITSLKTTDHYYDSLQGTVVQDLCAQPCTTFPALKIWSSSHRFL